MIKFLVYGSKGWIGSQFIEILKNKNIEYLNGNSRVNNIKDVVNEITEYSPTHVVSFIGRTHGTIGDKKYTTIDYLEQPGKLVDNIRDNLFSPMSLALICKEKNIHLTYLGTGCIFKFDDEHPYGKEINGFTEESKPNFFESSYSIVKGFTDRLMHLMEDTVLNLRIRMPIVDSEHPRNFITKIVNYEKICNCPNSMTVLPELLPMALDMALQYRTGTINLTNPGLISHNEILDMYIQIVDPNFTYQNFTYEEQMEILDSGRSNNFLDTNKLQSLYPTVKNIKESVRNCLKQYKKSYKLKVSSNVIQKQIITIDNKLNLKNKSDNVLLVTGGAGFIGSNFINHIVKDYNKITIINLDALYYCADEKNIKKSIRNSDNYVFIKGNICSTDLVNHILNEYGVTHVVHFAAQSHVQTSFDDSFQYTQDNIVGTHRLLECCRLYKQIKLFIHVSTDEVYGESMLDIEEKSKTEHSLLCPTNPYAATKASAEMIAQSYCHSYKMPIIITRGNNVYGPNQYPEKLIPKFIKQLKNRQQVTIQGDGSCVRAFLHSKDTAQAFQTILEKGVVGEIYNIGCDEGMEFSVKDVADILIKKIIGIEKDHNSMWIRYIEDRPFNDKRYYISNQKLKDLGWMVTINLEEGLNDLLNIKKLENKVINIVNPPNIIKKNNDLYSQIKNNFFIMAGPNVIESEEHTLKMAREIKKIMDKYDITYIFKTSFDKANRTSLNSYRGLGIEKGLEILRKVKDEINVPIITDIHTIEQAEMVKDIVDVIQVPAFLCRQTDLLEAVAKTGKIIHVKKGQFCSSAVMHKCKEKLIAFGNKKIIICERGNCYGYQDLIVDPRNLVLLKSNTNMVSMDITHCLQKPAQVKSDGTVCAGGLREMIPYMGKMAISLGVDGIFMEVHDNPEKAKCDGPTQWPLDRLEDILNDLNISKL